MVPQAMEEYLLMSLAERSRALPGHSPGGWKNLRGVGPWGKKFDGFKERLSMK